MQIHLLRHGIAEDPVAGRRDFDRTLTADGRRKLRALLKRAEASGVKPSLVMSSPFVRARETAEIAAEIMGPGAEILYTQALQPSADPEDVWEEIRLHKEEQQVLLVGHEPLFSRLTGLLLNSPQLQLDFKKGALLRVDIEPVGLRPRGVLKWLLVARFC